MRRFLILIIALLVVLIPFGLLALGVIQRPVRNVEPRFLTMWVTHDGDAYRSVIAQYNALRPYIKVTVEEVPADGYKAKLKDAWSRGKGPDIFELPVNAVGEFENDYLAPLPANTKVYTYQAKKVFFRSEVQISQDTVTSLTIPQIQQQFVDVVSEGIIRNGKIFGLPLSLDTLVLYYNKELLRGANVVAPPSTWLQLTSLIPKLTTADDQGKIIQSGIALGTGKNVNHSADIISLLMLQDGVTMSTVDGLIPIDESFGENGDNLGANALSFYSSFANQNKATYAWNAEQPSALDSFIRGKTAMYIGYRSDKSAIDATSSVDVGVAPIPHLSQEGKDSSPSGQAQQVNFGNFNILSVFKRSDHVNEAWNLVQFLTKQPSIAKSFLGKTGGISALRSVVQEQQADPELSTFAQQAVSARMWYRGRDASATENALITMLDSSAAGTMTPLEALSLARKQIELTTLTRQ